MTKLFTLLTLIGTAGLAFAGDAPKADPKAAGAGGAPAMPKMEMPKPAPEIADMAKAMTGTWKCDGTTMGADMKSDVKMKGTLKSKTDLDGFWIHDSFDATAGEGKAAMKFKMESYITYDGTAKKWHNLAIMNDGGQMVGTSDGMKDMKMDINSDTMSPMGAGMFKDHMDASDQKKGAHMWGEMSMDKGKSWNKVYDMVCKK